MVRHSIYDRTWQCPKCGHATTQPKSANMVAHRCPKTKTVVVYNLVKR